MSRLSLATVAGYAFVWLLSDAEADWKTDPTEPVTAIDAAILGLRGGSAAASRDDQAETVTARRPAGVRVAPPFDGLSLSNAAIALARQAEPLRLEPVRDEAGAWIIGFGRKVSERPLRAISAEEAEAMLREDLAQAEAAVRRAVRTPLNDNEYAALVEFARSVGAENFEHTLVVTLLNVGDRAAAADAFLLWTQARVDGALVESPELVAQRERTRALFLSNSDSIGS